MVASRPFPTLGILFVVLAVVLLGCGAREDARSPSPKITPASSVPSTAAAASAVTASLAPVENPAVATPAVSDPGVSTASTAPRTPTPRTAVAASLRVGLRYTPGPDWVALADAPGLLELAYAPGWAPGDDPPVLAVPRVAVGVPVGPRTVSDVLTRFRSRPVAMGCPELVTPGPIAFAGLSGTGFACSGDSKGATRLYQIAGAQNRSIDTRSREVLDGWFLLTEGGWSSLTIVMTVRGSPAIVTVFGALSHGPASQGLSRLAIERVQDLGLTFAPR